MNDYELKTLINTQPDTRPLQVGDRVRVKDYMQADDTEDGVYYNEEMANMQGHESVIADMWKDGRRTRITKSMYTWIPDWLERVDSHE